MKILLQFIILTLLCSCSAKYGLFGGMHGASYMEEVDSDTKEGDMGFGFKEYDNAGGGYHVGISEESNWILTKIGYFKTSYDEKEETIDSTLYKTAQEESGVFGSIGLKLWYFQPHILVKNYDVEYTKNSVISEENFTSVGLGLDFEIPVTKRANIYIGYNADAYIDEMAENSDVVTQTLIHGTFSVGFRYNFIIFGNSKD